MRESQKNQIQRHVSKDEIMLVKMEKLYRIILEVRFIQNTQLDHRGRSRCVEIKLNEQGTMLVNAD